MKPEDIFLSIAGDILDGRSSDWTETDSLASTLTASHRAVLAQLRTLAGVGSIHERIRREERPGGPLLHSTWGHLRLDQLIGIGVFGTVYRAWDLRLDREVALKLFNDDLGDASSALREARLLAKLRHPNVAGVYGADVIDGRAGLWMEYVEGETLEQLLRREGPLALTVVESIARQLCDALEAVHRAGVVHGDVKAHNVVRQPDGRVALMDFGAGTLLSASTSSGAGTPLYLAPEVCLGEGPTDQSDIYSLGVLLFHLVTGAYPVTGGSFHEIRARHERGERAPDVRTLRPDVPHRLTRAITQALAPSPSERFASVDELRHAIAANPSARALRYALISVAGIAAGVWLILDSAGWQVGRSDRTRLAADPVLALSSARARQIALPDGLFANGLSRDGRVYSYSTSGGDVASLDMSTGASETHVTAGNDEFAEFAISAPDGNETAYEWWTAQSRCEIRIVNHRSREIRIVHRESNLDYALPVEWTADARSILTLESSPGGSRRIVLVDSRGGPPRIVRAIGSATPLGMSISPDGRYVAYDIRAPDNPSRRELRVAATDGSTDRLLLEGQSGWSPVWTPDGSHVFFLSDRSGTVDGWLLPVAGAAAAGEPELAARNLMHATSLGMTASGTYYYRLQAGSFDIDAVPLEPQLLTPVGSPRRVPKRLSGSNIAPSYSPDGKSLLYVAVRDGLGAERDRAIVIRDLASGNERTILPAVDMGLAPPRWAPDGRQLLVRGILAARGRGLYTLDAETGAVTHEVVRFADKNQTDYSSIGWAAEKNAVMYEHAVRGLVRHDLESNREEVIYRYEPWQAHGRIGRFVFAPGSRSTFAFSTRSRDDESTLLFVVEEGVVKQLASSSSSGLTVQGWTSSAREIIYTVASGGDQPHQVWAVPVQGGPPRRLRFDIRGLTQINPIAIHPSDTEIAYTTGSPLNEIWMMENFLKVRSEK